MFGKWYISNMALFPIVPAGNLYFVSIAVQLSAMTVDCGWTAASTGDSVSS